MITRDELHKLEEEMKTPIDFDSLIAEGVLKKSGKYYVVQDMNRLPETARKKIVEMEILKSGGTKVKFSTCK